MNVQPQPALRLADLLAALSLVSDLGMGHPPEEAMRTCLLATGLARQLDLAESDAASVYWTALLMHVGCSAFAHEQAAAFGGDEIVVNAIGSKTDFGNARETLSFLLELGHGRRLVDRGRILLTGIAGGARFGRDVATATCEVATLMGRRLGLPLEVQRGLHELFERWDGSGAPQKLKGENIAVPARLAQLAAQAIVFERLGGIDASLAMVRRRAGGALDPAFAEAFARHGRALLQTINGGDPARAVIDAEPDPQVWIGEPQLDDVAHVFADAIDLKSTFTLGHSAAVAALSEQAARLLGLPESQAPLVRRAGLLHDLGHVGVPNGIWEKPGPLSAGEWEQVRLHAYHGERILSCSPVLAPLAPLVGMHHERLDGSGYHRRAAGPHLSLATRVLGAADAFQAMTQACAYRPAMSGAQAADALVAEARAGRLDRAAADAVLAAGGQPRRRTPARPLPCGLSEREVDVLRLLARGHSNKQMGRLLSVSPKTVGHHVEHIYDKLGVSSRAAAAMLAAQHGLLD
jgi:HD-GYP domain-containing protein (c-di-GMP phosphodiesterase class II)/DNA-binding CsgD family transcriptional regulator